MIGAKHAQMGPGRFLRHAAASTATRSGRIRQPDPRAASTVNHAADTGEQACYPKVRENPASRSTPPARQSAKRLHVLVCDLEARQPPLPTSPGGVGPQAGATPSRIRHFATPP